MKLSIHHASLSQLKTDLLGVGVVDGKIVSPLGREIDRRLGGFLSKLMKREDFQGKPGETRLIDLPSASGPLHVGAVLLIGMGKEGDLRKASAQLVRAGTQRKAHKVTWEDFKTKEAAESRGQAIAEGALLGNYRFDLYRSKKTDGKLETFEILGSADLQKGIKKGTLFAQAVNFSRDLVNIPATDMTPARMAEEARKIGRLPHLSAKILNKKEIERLGMGCYLAVASGSTEPPYFLHLRYRPVGRSKKTIALIGKGVTFDSGGLSLKTAQSMETMKDDMSGAAAVLAVMKTLSVLQPSVTVHGIAAVTENMPSGSAVKPGDVVRSMSGKTVEILNTDAEGRLTLADAMTYTLKQKPDLVIDVATLTGACVIALGELCSGILGNNESLVDRIIACGKQAGEKIWPLPLVEEYKEDLKSSIADLKNIGGRWGGTINGALFIQEFTDPKIPWAHIDIAGPSWTEKDLGDCPRGATGHIVRTLLHFVLGL